MQRIVDVVDIVGNVLSGRCQLLNAVLQLMIGMDKFAHIAAGTEDAKQAMFGIIHR